MTLKTFFKSQTFKCILVLLAIALVSGGLLSIASDVLFVSEEERTTRAIKSIYGSEIAYETVFDLDKADSVPEYATGENGFVEKVYILEDGNYLIKATGKNGYKNGTVSIWAVATATDTVTLTKITVASYDKQTLMSKFDGKVLSDATQGDVVVSGATFSARAFNNAVSAVQKYATAALIN
ncbi:MAG: hypothetical protein ACI4SK_02060 [Christensenellales bacterium]